jgi:3-oxoacyl-[acyl-carrier-protein] synthase III
MGMHAAIAGIEYYLPERVLSTTDLHNEFPEWGVEKIDETTGIRERHVAAVDQCSSDLSVEAARKLFESGVCSPDSIDYLILCTQTPDYFLPTTACLLQDRLGLSRNAGALDIGLGSSGYVYGLGLAEGLIASRQASNVLFITAETYTKLINLKDKSLRTIFGDAAAATLLRGVESDRPPLGPFVYGTDGSGGENLIVPNGGMRNKLTGQSPDIDDQMGNVRNADNLYMNGTAIFTFTINVVPRTVAALLERAGLAAGDVDLFVCHQANQYMLEHLRKRMKIATEKFYISTAWGNTASSSIPMAFKNAWQSGRVGKGSTVMLVGFGPGYSWGATLVRLGA